MTPAKLRAGQAANVLDQELLDMVLLQVDERRPTMPRLGEQVELENLLVAKEHPADVPGHALLHQALAAPESIEDLQRSLRPADRARADADGVILVEHQDIDASQRQIDRGGQSHRARAGDDYRPVPRRGGELGRFTVRIDRWRVGLHDDRDSGR